MQITLIKLIEKEMLKERMIKVLRSGVKIQILYDRTLNLTSTPYTPKLMIWGCHFLNKNRGLMEINDRVSEIRCQREKSIKVMLELN